MLTGISSSAEQAYIQKHPYLNGPDPALNRKLRQETRSCWTRVQVPGDINLQVTGLPQPEYGLDPALLSDRKQRPEGDPMAWRPAFVPYAWKVNQIPDSARDILSVGCGSAAEIGALRCLGKGRNIHAVDFRQAFTPEVQARYSFDFVCGHWLDFIRSRSSSFDAVFSNHCMEHIYNDPTEVLRLIAQSLRPGGVYVFAMPIEMSSSNPYSRFYPVLMNRFIYPWMLDAVDCGHPWKTDLPELAWRLRAAGFSSVEFFFREGGLSYQHAPPDSMFDRNFQDSWSISRVTHAATSSESAPLRMLDWLRQCVYRIKSRLKINILKNELTHEVLVRATKPPS